MRRAGPTRRVRGITPNARDGNGHSCEVRQDRSVRSGRDRTYRAVDGGDEARFRRLVLAHSEALANYLRRRLHPLPQSDLDDFVEETMAVVWRRLRHVPEGAEERPWIIGVARNVLRNAHRAERRRLLHRNEIRPPGDVPSAEEVGIANLAARAALETLSEPDREILKLFYWDALELEGTALVLGISSNAAGTRLSRAKTRFIENLELGVAGTGTDRTPSDMKVNGSEIARDQHA
jgi:RNA polymerase sigma-70 factor, ECF subfamily